MDKRDQIRNLFSSFICRDDDFFSYDKTHRRLDSRIRFRCENEGTGKCAITKRSEPIWSPAFGDPDTKVMLVAEAPSTSGGVGPHVGGLFADWDTWEFRDFFREELGYVPYLTDLVKCGPRDARDKTVVRKRARYCGERFLIEEIRIISPDSIYCVGRESYNWLVGYRDKSGLVNANGRDIRLEQIIHYSLQAGLPLTVADKKMIWRWQLGRLAATYTDDVSLSSLSFFQRQRDQS